MNGPDHYRRAEELLREAVALQSRASSATGEILAEAQVHATLAAAAASVAGLIDEHDGTYSSAWEWRQAMLGSTA